MFEIVELDPANGEEDHLVCTGTMAQMERDLTGLLQDVEDEWDTYDTPWPAYRIQPAS
jgi:hypothetical protein